MLGGVRPVISAFAPVISRKPICDPLHRLAEPMTRTPKVNERRLARKSTIVYSEGKIAVVSSRIAMAARRAQVVVRYQAIRKNIEDQRLI